jgi:hypothetical protein
MIKTIWHLGDWKDDYFGYLSKLSVESIFKQRSRCPLEFVSVDADKVVFSKDMINKLNKEADLLLVSGENLICDNTKIAENKSGWRFDISVGDLGTINVPIAAYGLSCSGEINNVGDNTWNNISAVINKSIGFSVTSEELSRALENYGADSNKVFVVPSSLIFSNADKSTHVFANADIRIMLDISNMTSDSIMRVINCLASTWYDKNISVFLVEPAPDKNDIFRRKVVSAVKRLGRAGFTIIVDEFDNIMRQQTNVKAGLFVGLCDNFDFVFSSNVAMANIAMSRNVPFILLSDSQDAKLFVEYAELSNLLETKIYNSVEKNTGLTKRIADIIANLNSYKFMMDNKVTEFGYIKDSFVDRILNNL